MLAFLITKIANLTESVKSVKAIFPDIVEISLEKITECH